MSEKIKRIEGKRDISVGTYFTNVKTTVKQIRRAYSEADEIVANVTGPWSKLDSEGVEAYGLLGNNNEIIEILNDIDGSTFRRKSLTTEYEFIDEKQQKSVIKGYKYSIRYTSGEVSSDNKINAKTNFIREAKIVSGSSAYAGVFFKKEKIEDYTVDISLNRTIDTLDTLSVKNNPLSEYPKQDSDTGVVMGTLYAKQKILDEEGEKVKIPLSNVPIAIFNPSIDFPNIASLDDDGNRIVLNMAQNSKRDDYADKESFILDFGKDRAEQILGEELDEIYNGSPQILSSVDYINVPEKYKYSTITNDKGEFIIQNVPVGNQILMFEVDLLKQGMTRSEVELNYFPYPVDVEPNVDSIPHFYFRQIPVGVSPSWGSFQTGYTQLDIVANIDMRKWTTFFVPPISVDGNSMTELLSAGITTPLTILAKDMTKEGYPLVSELVEVLDIYSRDETQRTAWRTEFKVRKNKAQFREDNFQAFKLPANLYDPNGKASADSARTGLRSKSGVWLSCYQMKMFFKDVKSQYRATGFVRNEITNKSDILKWSNHFDINRGIGSGRDSATGENEGSKVSFFPYERPWSINYPTKYSIPARPREPNSNKDFSDYREPRYLDGDLPGEFAGGGEANGWGLMQAIGTGDQIPNKFSTTVTMKRLYKYESNVAWHEEWSNGLRPYYHNNKNKDGKSINVIGKISGWKGRKIPTTSDTFVRTDNGDFIKAGFKVGDNIVYTSRLLRGGNARKVIDDSLFLTIKSVESKRLVITTNEFTGRKAYEGAGGIDKNREYKLKAEISLAGTGGEDFYPSKSFEVLNGEEYQRVESGFSYWLKPEGWARVNQRPWGDYTLSSDVNSAYGSISSLLPKHYRDVMDRDGERIRFKMGKGPTLWQKTGGLNIYRVIDDSVDYLVEPGPPEKKKFVNIDVGMLLCNNKKVGGRMELKIGTGGDQLKVISMKINITNNGTIERSISVDGTTKSIKIGKTKSFQVQSNSTIRFPSNSSFNIVENSYDKSRYSIGLSTNEIAKAGEEGKILGIFNKSAGTSDSIPTYYFVTTCSETQGRIKVKNNGTRQCGKKRTGTYKMNGVVIERSKSSTSVNITSKVTTECSDGGVPQLRTDE